MLGLLKVILPKSRKQWQRFQFLLLFLVCGVAGVTILLYTFKKNLVFYYTPIEIIQLYQDKEIAPPIRKVRVGGLVRQGSVQVEGARIHFDLTDSTGSVINVVFTGVLPSLFAENKGAISEGSLNIIDGLMQLQATSILAKHDETYKAQE